MPFVTLDTLPLDILDLIFQFLEGDPSTRRGDLRHLCLTCRKLLPPARRFLYAAPLRRPWTWVQAIGLLRTLKANPDVFGQLVRDLYILPEVLHSLSQQEVGAVDLTFVVPGERRSYSWFLGMLETCTKLKTVGVTLADTTQLDRVIRHLKPSLATLQAIKLEEAAVSTTSTYPMTSALVQSFAAQAGLRDIERFEVGRLRSTSFVPSPQIPFDFRVLVLDDCPGNGMKLRQFLPTRTSHLRSLVLHGRTALADHVISLIQLAARNLTHLSIDPGYSDFSGPEARLQGPTIPAPLFSLLRDLRYLRLAWLKALSVERIRALSATSTELVELICTETAWISDEPCKPAASPASGTASPFPQDQLTALFEPFRHLKRLDIGCVPLTAVLQVEAFQATQRSRGVEVMYQLWRER
ncbi:hypothetical protein JCM8097_007098 [Rhodosporidiobolus ruineniae]